MWQKQNGPVTNRSCKGQLSSVQRILACSKGPWLVGQHHGPRMHACHMLIVWQMRGLRFKSAIGQRTLLHL